MDNHAAQITYKKFKVRTAVIGSPRHWIYEQFDITTRRDELRQAINIKPNQKVIGIFGQSLHQLPGYIETISLWLDACLKQNNNEVVLFYRRHPRETTAEANQIIELIKRSGLDYRIFPASVIEESLMLSDLVCSFFSNCLYDAAYLNYYSPKPLIIPVILNYHPKIKEHTDKLELFECSPYRNQGLAYFCMHEENLTTELDDLLSELYKQNYWRQSKVELLNSNKSIKQILSILFPDNYQTMVWT